jgi:hypothetical protein
MSVLHPNKAMAGAASGASLQNVFCMQMKDGSEVFVGPHSCFLPRNIIDQETSKRFFSPGGWRNADGIEGSCIHKGSVYRTQGIVNQQTWEAFWKHRWSGNEPEIPCVLPVAAKVFSVFSSSSTKTKTAYQNDFDDTVPLWDRERRQCRNAIALCNGAVSNFRVRVPRWAKPFIYWEPRTQTLDLVLCMEYIDRKVHEKIERSICVQRRRWTLNELGPERDALRSLSKTDWSRTRMDPVFQAFAEAALNTSSLRNYMEGEAEAELECKPLHLEQWVGWYQQLISFLAYMNSQGWFHGDIQNNHLHFALGRKITESEAQTNKYDARFVFLDSNSQQLHEVDLVLLGFGSSYALHNCSRPGAFSDPLLYLCLHQKYLPKEEKEREIKHDAVEWPMEEREINEQYGALMVIMEWMWPVENGSRWPWRSPGDFLVCAYDRYSNAPAKSMLDVFEFISNVYMKVFLLHFDRFPVDHCWSKEVQFFKNELARLVSPVHSIHPTLHTAEVSWIQNKSKVKTRLTANELIDSKFVLQPF